MIKAMGQIDGKKVLVLALSFENLDRLRADGLNGYIHINGEDLDLPFDIHITAAETEKLILQRIAPGVGPHTKVHITDKAKKDLE